MTQEQKTKLESIGRTARLTKAQGVIWVGGVRHVSDGWRVVSRFRDLDHGVELTRGGGPTIDAALEQALAWKRRMEEG